MSFALPIALLLLPLPVIVWRLAEPAMAAMTALRVTGRTFEEAAGTGGWRADRIGAGLRTGAWILLVMALAGPRILASSGVIPVSGRDIMIALDLSGSMLKTDFSLDGAPISRLDAVKRTASAFVAARRGDRIGLVIFGDRAYVAQAPTFDVASVADAIAEAEVGISGRSTAIADGLGVAMKEMTGSEASTRVVVLLSDGVDTASDVDAVDAARLAARHGFRIHTIALGPEDLESQPAARDAVDAATLRAVAEAGSGESFRVRTTADLTAMAATLDRLEPNPSTRPPLRTWRPLWHWPAAGALVLLVAIAMRRRS